MHQKTHSNKCHSHRLQWATAVDWSSGGDDEVTSMVLFAKVPKTGKATARCTAWFDEKGGPPSVSPYANECQNTYSMELSKNGAHQFIQLYPYIYIHPLSIVHLYPLYPSKIGCLPSISAPRSQRIPADASGQEWTEESAAAYCSKFGRLLELGA